MQDIHCEVHGIKAETIHSSDSISPMTLRRALARMGFVQAAPSRGAGYVTDGRVQRMFKSPAVALQPHVKLELESID
jgi:hypothetical protein